MSLAFEEETFARTFVCVRQMHILERGEIIFHFLFVVVVVLVLVIIVTYI